MKVEQPPISIDNTIVQERNHYFLGKPMSVRDYRLDQEYFLSRHRAHNRLLHGWGVLCGLSVTNHPRPDCKDSWVVVCEGIAIDCYGREIIVPENVAFELDLPDIDNDDHDKYDDDSYEEDSYEEDDNDGEMEQVAQQESAAQETRKRKRKRHDERRYEDQYLLCLYYCEEYVEPIQIPYDTCDPTMTTGNRIREGYELRPIPFDDISAQCWLDLIGDPCTAFNDDCGSEPLEECASCMTPDCPCGTYVPLALITRTSEGIDIDMSGVRRLLTPPRYLTHIIDTSWEHGGTLELDELRDERGELRIYFDRSLLPNNGKIGISEATFSVYALDEDQELRFLGDEEVRPRLEDHDQNANSVAVFTIERKDLTGRKTIAGSTLYITLKCDFILDCHNNPVDGNFLCAQFPTGDGISGGTFESWFHVVDSRDSYD